MAKAIKKACTLMQGTQITETAILRNPKMGEELHFWGLTSGETLLLKRIGRRWISAEKVAEPIGIARHRYKVSGPVRDHEWSTTEVRNRELRKNPALMADAAARSKRHEKMFED